MDNAEELRVLGVEGMALPPMSIHLPDGMHAIEVSADETERTAAVMELVREIYPQGEEPLWEAMGALYGATAQEMASGGVSFFGIGLYDIGDGGGVAHCSLTVAVFESGAADPDVVAQGIFATLGPDPLRDVTWLDLPCGPAVSVISFRKLVVDGQYTRSGSDEELTMGQIQVHVPFSTGPYTAVITLDTASVEQWDEFTHAIAGIVGSLEFLESPSTGEMTY
ncbi:hypothetical protein ACKI1I_34320 [Streptomyces turgidiscabies]|uniref:Uncharacterized protein n=1 Tax=Streptomyces turgidiscabies (strain Car8) TaxID=698760 RepID=L7FCK6_STRT8|nr:MULTISPECIES: hypothetical protein [Streptomyces]ELP68776.1 hypothetical protein STRTUCAR8_04464 [Streptomyces turgidiscabies Car8]MDX3495848.1 hypothetical protein [Streptomyces turgidiscabies]GAQ72665.1 hypothetical protein T45_04419 [Streptomyces turgidiscabies]